MSVTFRTRKLAGARLPATVKSQTRTFTLSRPCLSVSTSTQTLHSARPRLQMALEAQALLSPVVPGSVSNDEVYPLHRSMRESLRLHAQYFLIGKMLGFQLHPDIPRTEPLHVADVGTGNACWLIDIASQLPPSSRFVGLDISAVQFPSPANLPSNISVRTFDIFSPSLPAEFIDAFDVVHIRGFIGVIPGGDPETVLDNALKMLRPGGYLQWDDGDMTMLGPYPPDKDRVPKGHAEEAARQLQVLFKRSGLKFSWVTNIAKLFDLKNIEVQHSQRYPIPREWYKLATDNWLPTFDDMARSMILKIEDSPWTIAEWNQSFDKLVGEIDNGVSLGMDLVTCLGKKRKAEGHSEGSGEKLQQME